MATFNLGKSDLRSHKSGSISQLNNLSQISNICLSLDLSKLIYELDDKSAGMVGGRFEDLKNGSDVSPMQTRIGLID